MPRELIDVTVFLHHETPAAWLVSDTEESERVWVPKSQSECDPAPWNRSGIPVVILTMPVWLAREKGLI